MKRSKTSKSWMKEHINDTYVKQAKSLGYRSRAAFKLIEANEKYHFLKKNIDTLDLGCAPGSWSQVLSNLGNEKGRIFALDILSMDPIKGVNFIEGDFREQETLEVLQKKLNKKLLDLVISDMAPNISGVKASDQASIIYLNELALQFARDWLKPKGNFLVKSFVGADFDEFVKNVKKSFEAVSTFKPKSSRTRSSEIFVYGKFKI